MVQAVQGQLTSNKLMKRPASAKSSTPKLDDIAAGSSGEFDEKRMAPYKYRTGVAYCDAKKGGYRVYTRRGDKFGLQYSWANDNANVKNACDKAINAIDKFVDAALVMV